MKKTLGDAARHIINCIPPEATEVYGVNPICLDVASEETVREGIVAFRGFLIRLYSVLAANSHLYDSGKRNDEHQSAAYFDFPFIENLQRLMQSIGLNGVLGEDSIITGNEIFNSKLSNAKNMELLRFLTDCGMVINGVDFGNKRQKFSEIGSVQFFYPNNSAMLTGLKVMAIAEREFRTNRFHYILMRCDYRVLMVEQPSVTTILKELIAPLPVSVQVFVLKMHRRHIGKGFDCTVHVWGFWVKIKHSHGKKELWGVNASVNQGYKINVKADNALKYANAISDFPWAVQELIAKGHGCGRKRFGTCDAGCEGLQIPLDNSVLKNKDGIDTWFEYELSCLRKRQ